VRRQLVGYERELPTIGAVQRLDAAVPPDQLARTALEVLLRLPAGRRARR
jgi:hypothetical protein